MLRAAAYCELLLLFYYFFRFFRLAVANSSRQIYFFLISTAHFLQFLIQAVSPHIARPISRIPDYKKKRILRMMWFQKGHDNYVILLGALQTNHAS
jgi:hypothetical protein